MMKYAPNLCTTKTSRPPATPSSALPASLHLRPHGHALRDQLQVDRGLDEPDSSSGLSSMTSSVLGHPASRHGARSRSPSPSGRSCHSSQSTPSKLHAKLRSHLLISSALRRQNSYQGPESDAQPLMKSSLSRRTLSNSSSWSSSSVPNPKMGAREDSTIKVFAQTLSQDVEYITLPVNTNTKSGHIIRSLLRRFRLKHRDPNLFYLTLERWIRKDGLRERVCMVLNDETCPLQLQQCCSNPPHNDIKFSLQMRTGALIKIYCQDVIKDARYKCVSLSAQTTVDETIELMLHCLNLINPSHQQLTMSCPDQLAEQHNNMRLSTNSPSSSTASTNSSSSGIESDVQTQHQPIAKSSPKPKAQDLGSRASSITSISTAASNSMSSLTEQYCLYIECKDTNYERALESDDYVVDVYQTLLAAAEAECRTSASGSGSSEANSSRESCQPDQWFLIKLIRRDDYRASRPLIRVASPRQAPPPAPVISASLRHLGLASDLLACPDPNNNNPSNPLDAARPKALVSTTQIELGRTQPLHQQPPGDTGHPYLRAPANARVAKTLEAATSDMQKVEQQQQAANSRLPLSMSNRPLPSLPPQFIVLPPVKPRRRNLPAEGDAATPPEQQTSASPPTSSFGRPLRGVERRRYDPAKLAEDLSKLNAG